MINSILASAKEKMYEPEDTEKNLNKAQRGKKEKDEKNNTAPDQWDNIKLYTQSEFPKKRQMGDKVFEKKDQHFSQTDKTIKTYISSMNFTH